ncbi:cytochrome P450 99A2-like [Hordeum vulgare subsp. vulgare]|nr:cytochrome P450 99A2-like [Hordeum vulgare subsp. vulgare]
MELSTVTLIFLSFVSVTIFVSLLSRKKTASSKERKPPGPRCLPFIGNLLHIRTTAPQVALRDLAKKYGPVMYLRLGQVDAVVISSPAAAQEVLRDSSLTFVSRPRILAAEIVGYGSVDIAFAPYGAYWRALRKLCMVELLSARKVRQFAPIRDSETMSLVRDVRAAAAAAGAGQPVNLRKLLVSCTNTITAKATFGDGCDAELQEQFLAAMNVLLKLTGGFCVGDLFPSLWFVDVVTGLRRSLWGARRQFDTIFDKIITICEARRAEKNKNSTGDNDLLSVMLRIKDEGQLEFPIGITNIKAIIVDLFTAGTETTSSILEWIMSELMRNPEVMAKAQAEVRQTLDNKSTEDHEVHMDKLRYMKMVIKEGLRLHPAAPLLLPRVCRETCNVGGFEIVEGSRVMVNAWAIARNPEYWHDADEFKPERFEDTTVDYNGTQFEYLPFGSGRRMCPGSTFGLATLEFILARLLYFFDWSLPAGMRPDELDMDMIVGATLRRRNHLHLVATPYNFPMKI